MAWAEFMQHIQLKSVIEMMDNYLHLHLPRRIERGGENKAMTCSSCNNEATMQQDYSIAMIDAIVGTACFDC